MGRRTTVAGAPDRRMIRYFDGSMTVRELDEASDDAPAYALQEGGFAPG